MKKNKTLHVGRRRFLQVTAGAGALVSLNPALSKIARAADADSLRPNIVLIITDEERHYSRTESLVQPELLAQYQSLMPGRMQLRANGVRFNNYFTPTAPCSPARSVIFTGHHSVDNGVVDNMDFDTQSSLNPKVPTMADALNAAGYYCAYKGKVHLTKDDVFEGGKGPVNMRRLYGFHDWQGPTKLGDAEGPLSGTMRDDDVAGYAQEWLETTAKDKQNSQIPFLLAVNFINPHDIMLVDVDGSGSYQIAQGDPAGENYFPLSPVPKTKPYLYWWNPSKPANGFEVNGYTPETQGPIPGALDEWASMLSAIFGNITLDDDATTTIRVYKDNTKTALGTKLLTVPLWQVYLNYYLNCILDNDKAVVRVLDSIKNNSFADNTLVIMTADHGELALSHMGVSRYFEAATTSDGEPSEQALAQTPVVLPLRQKGAMVYHENNQLPFIVARLSNAKASLVKQYLPKINIDVPTLASSVDLLPTLLAWAGKDAAWYSAQFGATLSSLNMLNHLPGVSLAKVIKSPTLYPQAQWSDGEQGRDWVLFMSDTIASSLDADFVYRSTWGEDTGCGADLTKRGCLRGLFDGTYKYARYFSPLDYSLNGAKYADFGYDQLVWFKHGQELQLFIHDSEQAALETYNSAADDAAPIAKLNTLLHEAMSQELSRVTVPPATVKNLIQDEKECQAA